MTAAPQRASALLLIGAAFAFGLAACGDDDGEVERQGGDTTGAGTGTTGTTATGAEESKQPSGPVSETVEIKETDFKLDPANPKVSRAGVVEFNVVNDGNVDHALEVEGPKREVETEAIAPGKSATLRADLSKPGEYVIYCPIDNHREQGMEGTVTVEGEAGTSPRVPEKEESDGDGGGGGGY